MHPLLFIIQLQLVLALKFLAAFLPFEMHQLCCLLSEQGFGHLSICVEHKVDRFN